MHVLDAVQVTCGDKDESVGTGSDFVSAPEDLSERPLMDSSLSCIATSSACCSSILSILISSM